MAASQPPAAPGVAGLAVTAGPDAGERCPDGPGDADRLVVAEDRAGPGDGEPAGRSANSRTPTATSTMNTIAARTNIPVRRASRLPGPVMGPG